MNYSVGKGLNYLSLLLCVFSLYAFKVLFQQKVIHFIIFSNPLSVKCRNQGFRKPFQNFCQIQKKKNFWHFWIGKIADKYANCMKRICTPNIEKIKIEGSLCRFVDKKKNFLTKDSEKKRLHYQERLYQFFEKKNAFIYFL